MSTQMINSIQLNLVQAVEALAPPAFIFALLQKGADPNDIEFLQALEGVDFNDAPKAAWAASVRAFPAVAEALDGRATMDQAAFDLVEAIETNDFQQVQLSLETLVDGGEDANFDMGEGSMLALAVRHRCDLEIIKLMLKKGHADVGGFCADALEVLEEVEEGAWTASVTKLLKG
jgi:hypothetical protein